MRWARDKTKDHIKNVDIRRETKVEPIDNLSRTETTEMVWPKEGEDTTKKMWMLEKRRMGEAHEKMDRQHKRERERIPEDIAEN